MTHTSASSAIERLTVFISYANEDQHHLARLVKHLSFLTSPEEAAVALWYDREIAGGEPWERRILAELDRADVILLLISADYEHSAWCQRERDIALKRAARGEAKVVPVRIGPTANWSSSAAAQFMALPKRQVISQAPDPEVAYAEVAEGLRDIIEQWEVAPAEPVPVSSNETSDVGAALRFESRLVGNDYRSEIRYLPEIFGDRLLEDGFPPVVGGISFPLDNPMQIGFSLHYDASQPPPSNQEQEELARRLGSYLNTCLVLTGDKLNVTLNPLDANCGLPDLLRCTELGRDMLGQDIVLKIRTAAHMHPESESGASFWESVESFLGDTQALDLAFRVWVVPDAAEVRKSSKDGRGHVAIEKFSLKVLCEDDYQTLQKYHALQGQSMPASLGYDQRVLSAFSEFVLPAIQEEVRLGPRFGLLRQMLSVLVVAKWIMDSSLAEPLTRAGFLRSNAPDKYGLNSVDEAVIREMKDLYLRLFSDGIWRWSRPHLGTGTNTAQKRLYVAGGIHLNGGC